MRIGVLTYHCPPNFGAQLQAISTVGFLRNAGHEVVVLNWYAKDLEEMYSQRIPPQQVSCHNLFAQKSSEKGIAFQALTRKRSEVVYIFELALTEMTVFV